MTLLLSIGYYLLRMAAAAVAGGFLWALSFPLRNRIKHKSETKAGPYREGAVLLLFMFLAGLLFLTLTPPSGWSYDGPFQGTVNLTPLRESIRLFLFYLKNSMWTALLVNFLGNIVMFIPIGLFAGLLLDRPCWWKGTLCAFALSLFIEISQLIVCRGTDVDDLILNALGGLMGHWLFLLLRKWAPALVAGCGERRKGSV